MKSSLRFDCVIYNGLEKHKHDTGISVWIIRKVK